MKKMRGQVVGICGAQLHPAPALRMQDRRAHGVAVDRRCGRTGKPDLRIEAEHRADDLHIRSVEARVGACQVPALLGQIEGEIASVTADGAYDGEPVYQAVVRHQSIRCLILLSRLVPRRCGQQSAEAQSQRDHHIRIIAEKGRMAWQKATGYGRRNLAETAVGPYKAIIGPKLRARILPAQQGEAGIATEVLNHMIRAAKPVSIRAT